tara:strand:- start:64 stop:315 length:252 start_codon:yes stop_codon:yes gene_type:complete
MDNNIDDNIDKLADLVMARIIEKYGDIQPLNLLSDHEEILIAELARLNTMLAFFEEDEEYRKAAIVLRKIQRIEKRLKIDDED